MVRTLAVHTCWPEFIFQPAIVHAFVILYFKEKAEFQKVPASLSWLGVAKCDSILAMRCNQKCV